MALLDTRAEGFAEETSRLLGGLGSPLRVGSSSGGVGLYSTRPIAAGELLISESPLTMTVASGALAHICSTCLRDSRYASPSADAWSLVCPKCASLRYCSPACLEARSQAHETHECAALAALSLCPPVSDGDLVRQAVRMLCDRAAGRTVEAIPGLMVDYSSHVDRLVGMERKGSLAHTAEPINEAVEACLRVLPAEARVERGELFEVLNRHQCNVHAVLGRDAEVSLTQYS